MTGISATDFIQKLAEALADQRITHAQFNKYQKEIYFPLAKKSTAELQTKAEEILEDIEILIKPKEIPTQAIYFGNNTSAEITIYTGQDEKTITHSFDDTYTFFSFKINAQLKEAGSKMKNIKYNMITYVIFKHLFTKDGKTRWQYKTSRFESEPYTVVGNNETQIKKNTTSERHKLNKKIEEMTENGSGWVAVCIRKFVLSIDRKSTRLNSSHIPLSRMPSSA